MVSAPSAIVLPDRYFNQLPDASIAPAGRRGPRAGGRRRACSSWRGKCSPASTAQTPPTPTGASPYLSGSLKRAEMHAQASKCAHTEPCVARLMDGPPRGAIKSGPASTCVVCGTPGHMQCVACGMLACWCTPRFTMYSRLALSMSRTRKSPTFDGATALGLQTPAHSCARVPAAECLTLLLHMGLLSLLRTACHTPPVCIVRGESQKEELAQAAQATYDLTGQTGSHFYMAPEVVFSRPYNEKVPLLASGSHCHL